MNGTSANSQIFSQFDQLTGSTTPTPTSGVPSRATQIQQLMAQSQNAQKSQSSNSTFSPNATVSLLNPFTATNKGTQNNAGAQALLSNAKQSANQFGNTTVPVIGDATNTISGDKKIANAQAANPNGADSTDITQLPLNQRITPEEARALNLTPEQLAGDIGTTALNVGGLVAAIPTGGASEEAALAADGALDGGEAVSRGAQIAKAAGTTAAVGGGFGAAQGATQAMSQNANAGQVAKSSAIGAGVGAATGGMLGAGAEALPEIQQGASNLVSKGKQAISDLTTPTENATMDSNLKDAEQSIFPKLTPTEKATIKVKDVNTPLGTKTVPDLLNDPKTRPIIESVANLPDDIKVKPSDSIAVKESKLQQGITRLHQGTEAALQDPEVRAQTAFTPKQFDTYVKTNFLDPIQKEFGAKSVEYDEALKATDTGRDLVKTNDAAGTHAARQDFDKQFKQNNPRAFAKAKGSFGAQLDPKTSAVIDAGRGYRNVLNDFTESRLPENSPFRSRLQEESNLIRAKEEMRARSSSDLGKSSAQRLLDRNPVAKKVLNTAAGAVKLGAGVDLINHL